jgi:hypothetical protein
MIKSGLLMLVKLYMAIKTNKFANPSPHWGTISGDK